MFRAASMVWLSTPLKALATKSMWLVVVANVMTEEDREEPGEPARVQAREDPDRNPVTMPLSP